MNFGTKKICLFLMAIGFFILNCGIAGATLFNVYAYNNSLALISLNTGIFLNIGDTFSITVDPTDTWSAGPDDRDSNANGLGPGNPYGGNYGKYCYLGYDFYYGSLVGQIDNCSYFLIGTDYKGTATVAGNLKLIYWDADYDNNSGFITANVTTSPVPLPPSVYLFGSGLIGLIGLRRFRRA